MERIGKNIYLSLLLHLVGVALIVQSDIIADITIKQPVYVSLAVETVAEKQEGEKTLSPSLPVKKKSGQAGIEETTSSQAEKRQENSPRAPAVQESAKPAAQTKKETAAAINLPSQTATITTGNNKAAASAANASGTYNNFHFLSPLSTSGAQENGPTGKGGYGSSDNFLQAIRAAIQGNLIYPYLARKRSMEGTVLVEFRINPKGAPEHVRILQSSGYSLLDTAAKETVVRSSPFPAANSTIEIPITFLLKNN